ncbi:MAG: type I secretion C-terminal target domain-containing protein [Mangrovicoccus sp.]|nr:type I secretion C-terminal target domain-containing protein [Mangrovicoccus sp.]
MTNPTSNDDTLNGTSGNDTLNGLAGDDYINGIAGDDSLLGALGSDTLNGGTGNDTLIGAAGDDSLVAGDGQDTLQGGTGNDSLYGEDGKDFLSGSVGDDYLDGGLGNDSLSGGDDSDTLTGGQGVDTLIGGGGDDYLDGGEDDDLLKGFGGNDTLIGGVGDDTLQGSSGDDSLNGGAGNDTLDGGNGADTLLGGAGADDLRGGEGFDYASYDDFSAAVTVDLSGDNDGSGDTFDKIEGLIGSSYNDTLTGDDEDNIIRGGSGADYIYGGKGSDTLIGGDGNDNLDGGRDASIDFVSYETADSAVTINLSNSSNSAGDTYNEIEGVIGSAFNDQLTGDAAANALNGGGGGDTLSGGAGGDTLSGGADGDVLDGGVGTDYASYADALVGVTAHLLYSSNNTGDASGDTYISVEGLIGSVEADNLIGNAENNILLGGEGNDTLEGKVGDDALWGGGDDDSILGGNGEDVLHGGDGNDSLNGNNQFDILWGGMGNDTLDGGNGNDTLIGGPGEDSLKGSAGSDVFLLNPYHGYDTIEDYNITQSDAIDLTHILAHYDPSKQGSISNFIKVEVNNNDTDILVDINGTGDFIKSATLSGVQAHDNNNDGFIDNINFLNGATSLSVALSGSAISSNISDRAFASNFDEFLGVCFRLKTDGSTESDPIKISSALSLLGIEHVRTGAPLQSSFDQYNNGQTANSKVGKLIDLANDGIKFNFLMQKQVPSQTSPDGALKNYINEFDIDLGGGTNFSDSIVSFEGLNEVDNLTFEYSTYDDNSREAAAQFQKTLWSAVDDSNLPLPILAPTVHNGLKSDSFSGFGDLSSSSDYSNAHVYINLGRDFTETFDQRLSNAQALNRSAPSIVTEMGYTTPDYGPGNVVYADNAGDGLSVSENDQAKQLLNMIFHTYDRGVERAYIFELFDDADDSIDTEDNFGLFESELDGNGELIAKKSATTIHNLMGFFNTSDDSATSGTTMLIEDYSLTLGNSGGGANTVRTSTIYKNNAADILIWKEDYGDGVTLDKITVGFHTQNDVEAKFFDPLTNAEELLDATSTSSADGITSFTYDLPQNADMLFNDFEAPMIVEFYEVT